MMQVIRVCDDNAGVGWKSEFESLEGFCICISM